MYAHRRPLVACSFFFNDPATTEIYTLSLHDALPILLLLQRLVCHHEVVAHPTSLSHAPLVCSAHMVGAARSEEHTSELQSQSNLVCRLLLEKKKKTSTMPLEVHRGSLRTPSLRSTIN